MPPTPKPKEIPAWQQDYAKELLRTINKTATFASRGGGWWSLLVEGKVTVQAQKRSDILAMTERLKLRENCCTEQPKAEFF